MWRATGHRDEDPISVTGMKDLLEESSQSTLLSLGQVSPRCLRRSFNSCDMCDYFVSPVAVRSVVHGGLLCHPHSQLQQIECLTHNV